VAAAQALEQDVEALQLIVAADEDGRPGAGIRGVGVLLRPDETTLAS
jgi:hypothetical protein